MKNDEKYTISKASEITGFSKHVLRFYEKEFDLEIPRNKSNHRFYTYKEIEKFLYIKSLKERGLSNQQIKTIVNSVEEIVINDEIAVTADYQMNNDIHIVPKTSGFNNMTEQIEGMKEMLNQELTVNLSSLREGLGNDIESLLRKYLGEENNLNTDKDTLISENARLKMKLKERVYETAILKEKIKKLENKKSLFQKIFSIKRI